MSIRHWMIVVLMTLTVAACGDSHRERMLTGASLAAGAGALIGAAFPVIGIVEAAATGAAIGGITGGLTDKDDLDLGDPAWEWVGLTYEQIRLDPQREDTRPYEPRSTRQLFGAIQWELYQKGYDPGRADGITDAATARAVARYQQDHGLAVDGLPTEALWRHMTAARTASPAG